MSFFSAIANMATGGLVGIIGQLGVCALEEWRAGRESARKIAEMKALAEIKAEEAAWNAFAASQKASEAPANVPAWCAATITLFRPGLTLLFFGLAAYAFAVATDATRAETLGEINSCAFGLAYWWFGSRYQARLRQK